jgi:hypothetical protein
MRIRILFPSLFLLLTSVAASQQVADTTFNTKLTKPAFTTKHPVVVIDQAHGNFHTASGRYKPLAELLRSDGYTVVEGTQKFDTTIHGDVLIIANAETDVPKGTPQPPAFTPAECDAVYEWVKKGGSLLLIADHTPYGAAAANLGAKFGVEMGKGFVFDPDTAHIVDAPTTLLYSAENKLLGEHGITRGRNDGERVRRVVAFTGQSLSVPPGATALMRIGPDAFELHTQEEMERVVPKLGYEGMNRVRTADAAYVAEMKERHGAAGKAQGIALRVGKGRVVMMGEAAMFSAQVFKFTYEGKPVEGKMGMNAEGNDDRQFALNVLHWLSGLLD